MNNEKQQIKEMAKCCTYYHNGECCADVTNICDCDLMCEMFGVFANLEKENYRKQSEGEWYVNYMMSKKPSKRGRTIQYTTYTCSVCGKPNGRKKSKFCPNCGAKMKGGAE